VKPINNMKVTTTITTLFLTIVMAVPTSYTEVKAHASDVANIRMLQAWN